MSPFIIFAIVLTIAYILYYATIITMDMNAKSKKEGEYEESIPATDPKEEEEEYKPQTVIENVETGGFAFIDFPTNPSEDEENIEEPDNEASFSTAETGDTALGDSIRIDNSNDEADTALIQGNEPSSSLEETQTEEGVISTMSFSESTQSERPEEIFEESKAFDPDLVQPQYAVSSIVTNEADAALVQRLDNISKRMLACPIEKGLMEPMDLVKEIRENGEKSNIALKNEYTQC